MAEEEKKKVEARQHANRLEALVHSYEQKNFELEEREMEVKYRLQMLENTMPALMMWNMWRMMCAMQGTTGGGSVQMGLPPGLRPESATVDSTKGINAKEEELLVKLKALETKLGNENRLLEESRLAEEGLRRKVRELETMLNRKDDDIIEILDRDPEEDVEVFEKLGKMARDRMDLDKRIKDLEMKEKLYQETLQQADTMFAEMEGGLTKQIREKDVELEEKESELQEIEAELVESQSRLKKASMFSEISEHLQEKIEALESEVTRLREDLNKRERERQALELEEKRLQKELQNCEEQLDSIKQTVEKPLRADLESEKRKSKALEGQLEAAEEEAVSKLKRQISRLTRDMLENDVTISELREEVQTLETTVGELRFSLKATKESREDLKKLLESEVERRDKTIEELRKSISEKPKKSLKEELEEVPKEMIEQEIVSSKGEFRRTSVEEVLAQESQQQQALEVIKEEAEEDVGEPVAEKPGIDESDAEMTEGERRLAIQPKAAIQQIESQVDSEATSLEIQSDEDLANRRDKRSVSIQTCFVQLQLNQNLLGR
ncbi:hypothetical protein AAG570_003181 [Ranatra chinensis]|uniref:Uncharacterized protein n=1 Tax=Ranatra chinensis TaxID=642074 RepID=A0ABD0Y614_9HEMI